MRTVKTFKVSNVVLSSNLDSADILKELILEGYKFAGNNASLCELRLLYEDNSHEDETRNDRYRELKTLVLIFETK